MPLFKVPTTYITVRKILKISLEKFLQIRGPKIWKFEKSKIEIKIMENEKSKKADFGKLAVEPFDKMNDYFKDLLSQLENYESYVHIIFFPSFLKSCQASRKINQENFEGSGF